MKFGSSPGKADSSFNRSDGEEIRNLVSDATLGKMREMRKSISYQIKDSMIGQNKARETSIKRASVSFSLAEGTEAGDIVIENNRLKSTLEILNQKIKVGLDTESTLKSKI